MGVVTTVDGAHYEGRLRFGGDEEALWTNSFKGYKAENPWVAYAPLEKHSFGLFGVEIAGWEREKEAGRPFSAQFGRIKDIEMTDREIHVMLKSGTLFKLDRMAADDLSDGLRVWDMAEGVIDLEERQIHRVEFMAAPIDSSSASSKRLSVCGPSARDRSNEGGRIHRADSMGPARLSFNGFDCRTQGIRRDPAGFP